ncbi:MAG: class I SAM-dependent methyltransferase [Parahaliea sp.]
MKREFNEIWTELETWYERDRGRYLLNVLNEALAADLETAFGYHLAQVGISRCHPFYDKSPVRHRIYIAGQAGSEVGLVAESDQLPLATDSVDVLIAHHCLEFSRNPHQVLRELHRVLTPRGHLFIIGFNPLSLFGMGLALRAQLGSALWRRRQSLSTWRLVDWLNVLGLEEEAIKQYYALPLRGGQRMNARIQRYNQWCTQRRLPIGGVYLIHAIKKVCGAARPGLRSRRASLIKLGVPEPVPAPRHSPTQNTVQHIQHRDMHSQ